MARGIEPEMLFIGVGGHALALDRATGMERWRTKLKGSTATVLLHRDGDQLYASASGELFCLDPGTGAIRWHNRLKGLGLGIVAMATELRDEPASNAAYVTVAQELARKRAQHASTSS
jgi:outer membrane protein assembly factor BamB